MGRRRRRMDGPKANTESDGRCERNNYKVLEQRLGADEATVGCQVRLLKRDDIRGDTGMVTRQEPSKYLRKGHCWQRARSVGDSPGASREEQDGNRATGWQEMAPSLLLLRGFFSPLLLAFCKDQGAKKRLLHREAHPSLK